MGRIYNVVFPSVAVSAAQDLLQIKGAAGKQLKIRKQWAGAPNTTLPTAQMLEFRGRFLPTTVTDGSGGSTVTPRPVDPGDAAATFTALSNNTTKATTSGTAAIQEEGSSHVYNQYERNFGAATPQVGPSQSYVFELLSTPSGTVNLTGGVEVEEIG
jgi:hypothetical protein